MQLSVGKSLALFKLHFKLYKIKKVCFGIILYELISSNYIKLNFLVNSSKGMFHINIENSDKQTTERMSIYLLRPIPPNIRLDEDVFRLRLQKTSSRRLDQDEYVCLSLTSSRRLQDVLVKTNIFVLAIRLQDVFKTSSRRIIKLNCSC